MNYHKGFIAPLLLALIALLLIGGGAYVYEHDKRANNSEVFASATQTSDAKDVKTYISQKLGIKFNYLAYDGEPITEEGNIVYVGGRGGQWVQKFTKDPKDGLATAIKKILLVGISEKDCAVKVRHKSASIDTASIAVLGWDLTKGEGLDNPRFTNNPCPVEYRETNGLRYFWLDENHPNEFFFFSIGQYVILGESDRFGSEGRKTWQDTFEILK